MNSAQSESDSSDVEDYEENYTASADLCSDESDAEDDDYESTDRESNFDKNEYIDVFNETASDPKRRKLSKVQQVSFHKIANRNDLLGLTSEAIIEKIVNKYNNKNSHAKYLREMPTKIPKVNEHSEDEQFKIMIYIQKFEGSSRLLENYGISFVLKTFNAVIFHYKTDCVYVVSKGSGWRLIQSYVDYEFPQKVAARILSEKGRISFADKQLLGNARSVNTILKNDEPTDRLAIAVLCTKFTARLRPKASILKFDCFKNKRNSFKQAKQIADVKVEIGFGSVRFRREFEVEDFFLILEHLNKIDRGDKTFTTDGQEENSSKAFYRYLQKVPPSKEDELNLFLVKKIQDDVQNHKTSCLEHFDLCHKYTEEFTYGSEYTLYYNKNFVKKFSKAPSFESILMNLRTEEKCKSLRKKNCSIENFGKKLCNVRISFKQMNEEIISAKLLDYIEGNIFFEDQFYWRVMTKWCCVSEDYLKSVQKAFVDLLNKHLMDEKEIGYLWKPWNHKVSETNYNKSYSTENGFIVGDGITVKCIELFDLMFQDQKSNSTFLYHVKKDFGRITRDACSQMINSAKVIGCIMQGKSAKPDTIEEAYEKYMKNQKKEELPNFMSTCDKFKQALEKPTLVFAVAPNAKLGPKACQLSIEHMFSDMREREKSRSLHLEKKLKDKIFAIEIETQLKKIEEKHYKEIANILCETNEDDEGKVSYILSVKIVDELKQENYIDSNGEVTSKLLYCSKGNFELPSFKEKFSLNKVIYDILSPYFSFFDSLIAKLEVIRTRNELARLGFDGNHFKICEIRATE
jgi:stress-induced morphogen